jgi:hypothetical protein
MRTVAIMVVVAWSLGLFAGERGELHARLALHERAEPRSSGPHLHEPCVRPPHGAMHVRSRRRLGGGNEPRMLWQRLHCILASIPRVKVGRVPLAIAFCYCNPYG